MLVVNDIPNKFELRFLIHTRFIGLFILKLLMKKPMHGYQLTTELNAILGAEIPRQLIYFILNKFEKRGFVSFTWSVESNKRPRKIFYITNDGRKFYNIILARIKELINLLDDI